ncbi:hypothetical protein ACIRD3_37585 [Kitasatospora sp. NPDC093550]|uniref:hypothetical protein n=1 Tax=Kitasatospora sp. NPDC093550 TaxID=3364089 RepID=UPI0037F979C0
MLRRGIAALVAAAVVVLGLAAPASADGCPPDKDVCIIVKDPGTPGGGDGGGTGGGGGGGGATCTWQTQTVPCNSPDFGWYNAQDGCYYNLMNPQPDPTNWVWMGHQPGDGAVYGRTCPFGYEGDSAPNGPVWLQNPPPGFGGGPTPAQLAREIFAAMSFDVPDIGTAPDRGGKGVIGMPVWLWAKASKTSWGPWVESKSAGGLSVSVTAKVTRIDWSMGDGGTRSCTTPGTPYSPDLGAATSPDCGYRYTTTSAGKPGGKFPVSATTTWTVHWEGGGQQGDLPAITKTSTTELTIGEVQILN